VLRDMYEHQQTVINGLVEALKGMAALTENING
jgi:hypothetical protein